MTKILRVPFYLGYVQVLTAIYTGISNNGDVRFFSLPPVLQMLGLIVGFAAMVVQASLMRFCLQEKESFFVGLLAGMSFLLNLFMIAVIFPRSLFLLAVALTLVFVAFRVDGLELADRMFFGFLEPRRKE